MEYEYSELYNYLETINSKYLKNGNRAMLAGVISGTRNKYNNEKKFYELLYFNFKDIMVQPSKNVFKEITDILNKYREKKLYYSDGYFNNAQDKYYDQISRKNWQMED